MSDDDLYQWNDELSDRETYLIGKVIAQWSALEYEIFFQTLMSFDAGDEEEIVLPKAMNNLQFTEVLSLWAERVVAKTVGERGNVLLRQHERILALKGYRDALVHGMWQWSKDELSKIVATRVRKKEIVAVHFTADDLSDFFRQIGGINFKIRFPGGAEDMVKEREKEGFHFSRMGLGILTGHPIADDRFGFTGATDGCKTQNESDV